MQMCEDSGSDISGTERLLLIGKHSSSEGAQQRGGGSWAGWQEQPRGLSAPWEPEPVLRRPARRWLAWELQDLRWALGTTCFSVETTGRGAMPRPPPVALGKSRHLSAAQLPHL